MKLHALTVNLTSNSKRISVSCAISVAREPVSEQVRGEIKPRLSDLTREAERGAREALGRSER